MKRLAFLALVFACASKPSPSLAPPRAHETTVTVPPEGISYYERLKSAVYGEWQPVGVWKALPPDERTTDPKTLTTIVRAELLPDGSLWSVRIKTSSGLPTLDDECLRAFHAAAPFPNPPPELFTNNMWAFDFAFNFDIGKGGSADASPAPP